MFTFIYCTDCCVVIFITLCNLYCPYSLYCALDLYSLFTCCQVCILKHSITLTWALPSPLLTTIFSFTSLTFLGSTCKCYHTVFVFLWLILLNKMCSRSIFVVANGRISFLMGDLTYLTGLLFMGPNLWLGLIKIHMLVFPCFSFCFTPN